MQDLDFAISRRETDGHLALMGRAQPVAQWLSDHVLGLLDLTFGDAELGEDELRTAIADYRKAGTRAVLADALADLATLTGDEAARTEAVALADELGMKGIAARLTT